MKKLCLLLTLLLAASSMAVSAYADKADATASYATTLPVIDGKIDEIWNTTEAVYSDVPGDGVWEKGENDYGYAKVLWTEDSIYLLGVVDDVNLKNLSADNLTNTIDFWISETNSGASDYSLEGDFVYCLNGNAIYNPESKYVDIYDASTFACTVSGNQYIVEAEIPIMTKGLTYSDGHVIGFNISIDDDVDGDTNRDAWCSWQEYNGRPYWSEPAALNTISFNPKPEIVVETEAETEAEVVEAVVAPQTFDMGVIAAAAAVVSAAGYAISKKQK